MDYLSEKEMITDYARELKINVLQNELEDFITLATQENFGKTQQLTHPKGQEP